MPRLRYLDVEYEALTGETVLEALLRQGAQVPYSCRRGSCHTCALHCSEGQVEHGRTVDAGLLADGHILPCVALPLGDLALGPARLEHRAIDAEVLDRRTLAPGIVEFDIAPLRGLDYRAGQHVQLVRADGLHRPYSLACTPDEDYFLRIHVRRVDGGAMSAWLCDTVQPGQRLALRGPGGDCCYDPAMRDRPLLLMATGTGIGALAAVARDALAQGHRGPIALYHGVRDAADLYLHAALQALAQSHPQLHYVACVTGDDPPPGARRGRITDALFADHPTLDEAEVFLCGMPLMVEEARHRATLCGARRERIHTDPFDFAHPPMPRDGEKLAALQPDPELWAALEHGPRLTRILDDLYTRIYADPRLSPYFTGVPKSRAVQKQYEFLQRIFTGTTDYLGLNPYNAHHWMVISDDLFDHREALFEQVLAEHAFPPHLARRWIALHELFRTDMVKPAARGMVIQGVEQPLHTHSVEMLDIDTVCDSCGEEIPAGTPARYHYRVGSLHCARCARIPTGAT